MISVDGVTRRFGDRVAVGEVSFTAEDGAITYLLGPNGAGKTTVMRMIAGLVRPDAGRIRIDGTALPELASTLGTIGFALGAFARNPRHTAEQHLRWQAALGGRRRADVGALLERVGLGPAAKRPVGRFSYGMLQRLGIAAALLGEPGTIVLDEPANGLDVEGTLWLRELLTGLAADGTCLLVASHDLTEVAITGTRIVVMGAGAVLWDASRDETVARGSGERPLEAAYLEITRGSVEYAASGAQR